MSKDNLELWNKVEKTNPNHTKSVTGSGRKVTAINAQQQIKNATENFGKYGDTWGLKEVKLEYINNLVNSQILCVAQAVFYYPNGEFEIGSSILVQSWVVSKLYNKVDDDFLKKLETDMTTKSLSKLGFNADVFLGYYDDNKYVTALKEEFNPPLDPTRIIKRFEACKDLESLKLVWISLTPNEQSNTSIVKSKDEIYKTLK